MSICCFPNCAYLSETSRMIAVYQSLVACGEKPIMATHGGTYEFVLKEENIPYQIVKPQVSKEWCQQFVATNVGDRPFKGFYTTHEKQGYYLNLLRNYVNEKPWRE